MLSISLVLALFLDRIVPGLQSHVNDYQLRKYISWLSEQAFFKAVPSRLLPYFLILPLLLIVAVLARVFSFSLVFELGFNLLIAFICLQPRVLNEEVDDMIQDFESTNSSPRQDIDQLFFNANRRLFSIIFWMVVGGPIWMLGYRLLETLLTIKDIPEPQKWTNDVYRIVSWLEWLPALISSYLFMLCGNFETGLKVLRNLSLLADDIGQLNESRLRQAGLAAVRISILDNESFTVDTLRRSRGMLLRTLVVWLLLALLIDYWL